MFRGRNRAKFPGGLHAVTDHSARHDLSLPAAGRFWRAQDDVAAARFPRSESDCGKSQDRPIAEYPSLRSDSFDNHVAIAQFSGRSEELRFESIVSLEHLPSARADCDLDDAAGDFPYRYSLDEMPDLARYIARHDRDPENALAGWVRQFLPAGRSFGTLELLTTISQSIKHTFRYRRREAKGVQPPVETLRLGHGSCRDFALLLIEASRSLGFAARFASGYLAVPLGDWDEPKSSARGSTHAWAEIYFAANRMGCVRPNERQRRQCRPGDRCRGPRSAARDTPARHVYRAVLRPFGNGRGGQRHGGRARNLVGRCCQLAAVCAAQLSEPYRSTEQIEGP